MKQIIAIQGLKGSGKDEVAKYLNYLLNTPKWLHNYYIAKLFNYNSIFKNWKVTRYAKVIKQILSLILNISESKFEDRNFKENTYVRISTLELISKEEANIIPDKKFNNLLKKIKTLEGLDLSIRQLMQCFGTELMRKWFGDNLWINITLKTSGNLIIADQRFIVENQSIYELKNCKSIVIHLIRNNNTFDEHSSELEVNMLLENNKYDYLIYNTSTLQQLFNNVKKITYECYD